MIKKFFFCFFLFVLTLWGDILDDKVQNLIGMQSYNVNKNFIDRIFKDREKFYSDGRLDIKKVVTTLKDNGLLILKFSEPGDLDITFASQTTPIFLARSINSALSSMGYSYFAVSQAQYEKGMSKITFSFSTEHALDPSIIINELAKRGYIFLDIKRNSITSWEYDIELVDPKLANTKQIEAPQTLQVTEVSGEYWFSVKGQGNMTITANTTSWRPRIVLYDKNLQIINLITQSATAKEITLTILEGVSFIMVTDAQNPAIIKNGIKIDFQNFDKK
ncbi:hypothetical protein [Helicobacter cappadocius]|uniref:Periplasmic protein n=1 Tax=Helicobacter cappadocius TaxID=3063998 RepID=A0AA90PS16_9HELI|nr:MULTISPECIES: hypothetical protein [unclassified Helicobacter]MDO7252943.1 hypothetical protein [Helicobacter sp. faydin-H75]MDP2539067.1 hypothetical protein [Helicobacter sp. faydin-H76]